MKTILHVLGELRPSGAEVMLRLAAETWKRAAYRPLALSTEKQRGPYARDLESAGYEIIHLPLHGNITAWARALLRILKSHNVNIVHVHAERLSVVTTILPRIAGRKTFRTVHNNFPYTGFTAFQK